MTNTINNVPRELLERLAEWDQFPHKTKDALTDLRALLSAPSPAGAKAGQEGEAVEVFAYGSSAGYQPVLPRQSIGSNGEQISCYDVPLCRLSDAQAIIDGLRGEVGAQRVKTCTALKDRNDARKERDAALAECERLRMQLAACGVVALANTIESAGEARQMHPDYMSASCSDVADAVDREIALRTERDQQAQRIGELEGLLRDERAYGPLGVSCQNGVVARCVCRMCRLRRIDAALSAGKDSEQ